MGKFRGSAQNSTFHGKMRTLIMHCSVDTYRNLHCGQNSRMMSCGFSACGAYVIMLARTRNLYGGGRARTSLRRVHLMWRWSLATTENKHTHTHNLLSVPRVHTTFASRGFSVVVPSVWNSLPAGIHACSSSHTS